MSKIITFPLHQPIIREYTTGYDITEWLGEKSINIIIKKNSSWKDALHAIYIYRRGGPLINYFDRRENPASYFSFRQKLTVEEKKIISKWLKKISSQSSYKRILSYLKRKSQ